MGTIGQLFSFQGRINRGHYAIIFLVASLVFFIGFASLIDLAEALARAMVGPSRYETVGTYNTIEFAFIIPWTILLFWISLANLAKRFHDINWSGAACLLTLIPLVGLVFTIVMMFVPGTRGPNLYGDRPGAPASAAALG